MPAATDPRAADIGVWNCVGLRPDATAEFFAAVASDQHPDATRVELPAADARTRMGTSWLAVAFYDENGDVRRVEVADTVAAKAPPLWFSEIRETAGDPPAVHLMAFAGHGVEPGSLLDGRAAAEIGVGSTDQLAAVRWWPATGEVDQIYVDPQWRRHTVAGALVVAAGTLSRARDWPRLWGDGQRTELGEKWRNAHSWSGRAATQTHVSPPMTPGDPGSVAPGPMGE